MNQENVEPGSFWSLDLCLNHLAILYLNIPQATLIPNVNNFVGLTPSVHLFFKESIFGIFNHTYQ